MGACGAACQLFPVQLSAKCLLRAVPRAWTEARSCCHHEGGLFAHLASLLYESSPTGCTAGSGQGKASYTEFQVPVQCYHLGLPSFSLHVLSQCPLYQGCTKQYRKQL